MNARHKAMLQLSRTSACDVLIVGGGATGLGVALEASRRGHSVVLAEAHDYASGTSSKATKLLHGGVRYLAQGRIHLVMEALAQRRRILALAPHVAQALAFVVPVYKHWHMPFYGAGLKAYEHLARSSSLGPTEWLSPSATLDALPLVNPTGLLGGIRYWDAQFDDARLAIELVKMAQRHGAQLFNYIKVTRLDAPQNGWRNVQLTDVLTQQTHHIKARCVVNATGVWTDDMQRLDAAAAQPSPKPHENHAHVQASQGIHLVMDGKGWNPSQALLVPKTVDGRVLFAVPWLGSVLLGTTDTPTTHIVREPKPLAQEVDFVLTEASKALGQPVQAGCIRSAWAGLRPLAVGSQSPQTATFKASREHAIGISPSGMVSVTGGKWTTFMLMAEQIVHFCTANGLLAPRARPPDRAEPPTHTPNTTAPPKMAQTPASWQGMGLPKSPWPGQLDTLWAGGLSEHMVRHMVQCEQALTVEDVLARRSRVLMVDAALAMQLAPQVAQCMSGQTPHDVQLSAFMALCQQYQIQ